jgi:hypothetical protein
VRRAGFVAVLWILGSCRAPGPLLSICLGEGGAFELHYVHSVERTPVVEVYRVHDGAIVLEGMRFRSLGWGLPSEGYVRRDGWFVVLGLGRRLGTLRVRTTRLNRHTLVVGDRTLPLAERVREGALVELSAARTPGCDRTLQVRVIGH